MALYWISVKNQETLLKELTKFEEVLLVVIWRLKGEAYGVKIRRYIGEHLKKDVTYGNLYSVLDQLSRKGYVDKQLGEATPQRRGRRKIYYSITGDGLQALKSAWEMNEILWAGLDDLAFEKN